MTQAPTPFGQRIVQSVEGSNGSASSHSNLRRERECDGAKEDTNPSAPTNGAFATSKFSPWIKMQIHEVQMGIDPRTHKPIIVPSQHRFLVTPKDGVLVRDMCTNCGLDLNKQPCLLPCDRDLVLEDVQRRDAQDQLITEQLTEIKALQAENDDLKEELAARLPPAHTPTLTQTAPPKK